MRTAHDPHPHGLNISANRSRAKPRNAHLRKPGQHSVPNRRHNSNTRAVLRLWSLLWIFSWTDRKASHLLRTESRLPYQQHANRVYPWAISVSCARSWCYVCMKSPLHTTNFQVPNVLRPFTWRPGSRSPWRNYLSGSDWEEMQHGQTGWAREESDF